MPKLHYRLESAYRKENYQRTITPPGFVDLQAGRDKDAEYALEQFKRDLRILAEAKVATPTLSAEDTSLAASAINVLSQIILSVSNPRSRTWYLPAARGRTMNSFLALAGAMLQDRASDRSSRQGLIRQFTGIQSDFVGALTNLPILDQDFGGQAATDIEQNVMGGRIQIKIDEFKIPHFSWKPEGWDKTIPLFNSSSMIAELTPVALYQKFLVQPGDLLIFEEPEAHLHPGKQVALISVIAKWVRSGIRVLLTTHSEWVLETLSNLVGENEHKVYDHGLEEEQVGIWQFTGDSQNGSKVEMAPWIEDEGGYEVGFYEVATELHNHWANILGEPR